MQLQNRSSITSTGDRIKDIKMQQVNILQNIEALNQAAGARYPQAKAMRQLQQEYNALVDEMARIAPSRFVDPLKKLPPELWPDIIEPLLDVDYPVDVLLELTSVSRTWRSIMISSPQLWKDIVFDEEQHDYLAKAVMGLFLSSSCEINVTLRLPPAAWKEAASLVLSETKRTRFLSMDRLQPSHAREVLAQIHETPILKTLYLPLRETRHLEDEDLESLGLKRMPLLRELRGVSISIRSRRWEHLITSLPMDIVQIMREGKIEQPQWLTNLRSIFYIGPVGFSSIVQWLGPGLSIVDLNVTASNFSSIDELASTLVYFPCLSSLTLARIDFRLFLHSQKQPRTFRSIKSFELSFESPDSLPNALDITTRQLIIGSLCEVLVAMAPAIEALAISYGQLTGRCCVCIGDLPSLLDLVLDNCVLVDYVHINARSLNALTCSTDSNILLAAVMAPELRSLRIRGSFYLSKPRDRTIDIPRCLLSGETISKIVSLTLFVDNPIRWELAPLSALRELELTLDPHDDLPLISSDVLEGILMRPSDLPALESVKLTGRLFEWDILLLLLERRILHSHLGISHIKKLTLTHDLPYKLLHPVTALLQGKLPERESNDYFSLNSAREQICDEDITGCYSCGLSFGYCDAPIVSKGDYSEFGECLKRLEVAYDIPSEYLIAEPPLSPDLAEWLSGRFSRRREFVRGWNVFLQRSDRVNCCGTYFPRSRSVVITGHSLGGVQFTQGGESSLDRKVEKILDE